MARNNTEEYISQLTSEIVDYFNGVETFRGGQVRNVYVSSRYYSGTVTPNFKSKKTLPFNPFHMEIAKRSKGEVKFNYSYPQPVFNREFHGFRRDWGQLATGSVSYAHLSEAQDTALKRLASKLAKQKTSLPLMFHERKKTADMIAKTALRIVNAARALKKLHFGEAIQQLKLPRSPVLERRLGELARSHGMYRPRPSPVNAQQFFSSAWLEMQYGWKPMLSDIYGAAEFLAQRVKDNGYVGVTWDSATASQQDDVFFFGATPSWAYGRKFGLHVRKSTCKIGTAYRVSNEMLANLSETGITNPALIVWDAIPLSFVVDWFLPVANYLENLGAFSGFDFVEIRRVRFTRWLTHAKFSEARSGFEYGGQWSEVVSCEVDADGVTYDRDFLSSIPSIPLTFKDPVSVSHATSTIALLSTFFGGKPR